MMVKLNLIPSSVSHDPSEIILICWFGGHFLLLLMLKKVVLLNIFVKHYVFFQDSLIKSKWKKWFPLQICAKLLQYFINGDKNTIAS